MPFVAAVALCLPAQGVEVYMRIVGETDFADEQLHESLRQGGFFKIGAVEIGVENPVNFSLEGGGANTSRASFKELQISKERNQVTTDIFRKLVTGVPYDDVEIILIGSIESGNPDVAYDERLVMKFELKQVFAQDLDFSVADGDSEVEESLVLKFGAIRISNYQLVNNRAMLESQVVWSQVRNSEVFSVTP